MHGPLCNTTPAALTPDQAQRVERAREILAEEHGYDPADMAGRIGALKWHLEELLALVGDPAAERAPAARPGRADQRASALAQRMTRKATAPR